MKKQIDFDFDKWGQEGISALDQNGHDIVNIVKLNEPYLKWVYMVERPQLSPILIDKSGKNKYAAFLVKMFEEVKPREFWLNVYADRNNHFIHFTKEEASFNRNNLYDFVKTIKLVEVIE